MIEHAEAHMEVYTSCGTRIMPLSGFRAVLLHLQHLPSNITLQIANDQEVVPESFVELRQNSTRKKAYSGCMWLTTLIFQCYLDEIGFKHSRFQS